MLLTGIISSYSLLFLTTLYFSVMPNLNEYYQLLQKEEPPLSNDALREMIASAVERADKEAIIAPQATEPVRRSQLNGTGMVIGSAAIIALTFWGFNYFQSQQSNAPQIHREAVQSEKSEVGTTGITTTIQESTFRSLDPEYKAQQTNQFLQPPFADIGHKARPQTKDETTATMADTLTKNTTTQTAVFPADSLLPEDFRSWEMPSYLAWAVAERRYNDALGILDSLLLRKHALPNTKFNLLCLRGHLHKIMASVNASIADYSSALDMHESSELYMLRGIQYRTASQHQEALKDFTNAIRLNPYNAQAVFMRGSAAHKLGRLQEACADWLAAAEMGNTVADSMLKAKCNPTVIQTIRTAQTKRSQDIKTLALLIERTKESIGKVASPNSPLPSLKNVVEALVKKIFSSACDIPTVLKGETSTHCAFQAIHTIAVELQDDSLAAMVKPVIQKKNNYSDALTSQLNNTPTNAQNDAISPSYFDMEVLTSSAKNNPRLQQRTHDYLMKTTPRYTSQMRENSSVPQNQTLPREILHNVIQVIEEYCHTKYPEIAAQAPSSVETKTMVPQQEEKQYWQRGRILYQQQYSLLSQLTQIALSQVGVKTSFSQLFAPCTLSAALTGNSTSDCVLSLLAQQAAQIQDTLLQSFAALALKNKNFTMPSQVPINAQQPQYQTETIVRPNPQALDIVPTGVSNSNHSQMATYTTVREIENAAHPEKQIPSTRRTDNSAYRQYLIAIQNHIWNTADKLERPKDSLAQPKPVTSNNTIAKEFQHQNLPIWFQEALEQHRYSYARSIVDSILLQESHTAELYSLRGDINKAMDSVEASIADYTQALSLQESSELYMRRGTQYFTGGKRQEAYDDFANAVRLEPKNYQAVYMRGAAAYNLKRFEEACDDWSLAAHMGHPFADSIMEVKCSGYIPKYARTAIAEKQQQSKNFLLLLERVKQGVQALPFDKKSNEPLKLKQQFDSLSYQRTSGTCTFLSALSGEASTYCMLHILYAQLLTMPEASVRLFATSLASQSSQLYNELPLSRPREDRQPFTPSPITNPKAYTLSAPTIRKTSLPEQASSNAISYKSTQNTLLTLLQQIRQYFLIAHPEMAEQKSDNVK